MNKTFSLKAIFCSALMFFSLIAPFSSAHAVNIDSKTCGANGLLDCTMPAERGTLYYGVAWKRRSLAGYILEGEVAYSFYDNYHQWHRSTACDRANNCHRSSNPPLRITEVFAIRQEAIFEAPHVWTDAMVEKNDFPWWFPHTAYFDAK